MTVFDYDRLLERLRQIQRPLRFAARQQGAKIAVVQDLETRVLAWLSAASAPPCPADIAANLDAFRRLFIGFDRADPAVKRQMLLTALGRLDHLMALIEAGLDGQSTARPEPRDLSRLLVGRR